MNKKIRVNAFDMNCVCHIQHGMWTHPRDRSTEYNTIQYWQDLARLAERGKFDGIFLADSVGVYDLYRGGPAPSIAGPTGIWRGVRDGMGCDLCIALGRRLCRRTVVAFDASPRTGNACARLPQREQ